jgi:hypothetical protein
MGFSVDNLAIVIGNPAIEAVGRATGASGSARVSLRYRPASGLRTSLRDESHNITVPQFRALCGDRPKTALDEARTALKALNTRLRASAAGSPLYAIFYVKATDTLRLRVSLTGWESGFIFETSRTGGLRVSRRPSTPGVAGLAGAGDFYADTGASILYLKGLFDADPALAKSLCDSLAKERRALFGVVDRAIKTLEH